MYPNRLLGVRKCRSRNYRSLIEVSGNICGLCDCSDQLLVLQFCLLHTAPWGLEGKTKNQNKYRLGIIYLWFSCTCFLGVVVFVVVLCGWGGLRWGGVGVYHLPVFRVA